MTWTSFAIASRRRLIATALIYGVTLAVRMTSAVGEEGSVSVRAAQCAALTSTYLNETSAKPASRMADIQGPTRDRTCRAGCQVALPT